MKDIQNIIIKPVISEKSLQEAANGKYTFVVAKNADKNEIRAAIEQLFGVKTKGVLTTHVKGTRDRQTRRGKTTTDLSYKKARVILEKGQKIALFEEATE